MKRFAAVLLTLAVLLCPSVRAAGPGISAASAILIDGESGRVLYAQNAEEERPIASITKLMTALVAVESHPDLSEVVTIRPEWTGVEGSSMYLKAGEELTLEALLYGLLLASGNDAAVAIAGFCAGDVDTFVAWMNDKAAELGMEHTHFENPNGLNDEGHYSTAADMAALARVVMEHEALAKIVGTRSITVAGRTLTNHNKLLWRYEGCTGLKTGYTDRAGRTLVSCAERDGQRLIAVTLNDPNDWADHAALFDYGFAHYRSAMLALANRTFRMLPVTGSLNRFVPVYTAADVYYPLTEGELVKARVELPERVEAPIQGGTIAGRLLFTLDGAVIGETYLLYAGDVADDRAGRGLFGRVLDWFRAGEADTLATYEVLKAQLERYPDLENDIDKLAEFSTRAETADYAGRILFNEKGEEVFGFGKYKGRSVEEVFRMEPSYYAWMMNGDFPLYTKKVITEIRMREKLK